MKPKPALPKDLTAEALTTALWDTLQAVRGGTISPGVAQAISTQSREIIRVIRTQIAIHHMADRPPSASMNAFGVIDSPTAEKPMTAITDTTKSKQLPPKKTHAK